MVPTGPAFLSIGELARMTGTRPSTLRYYESIGLLPSPARVARRRRYPAGAARHMELIRFARAVGFTLAEVAALQGGRPRPGLAARWRALARAKLGELELLLAQAHEMRRTLRRSLRCGCARIEECRLVARARRGRVGVPPP